MSSEIEDLHETIFGFRPKKAGTAYEQLAAVVLAGRGWLDVVHDTTMTPPGKRAAHQLDVTCRHPSGEIERLIVECKDWAASVEQDTLEKLVGVRLQIAADAAAVITTRGYTSGAVAVAADEDIGLWLLRPFEADEQHQYVRRITLTIVFVGSGYSDITVDVMPDHELDPATPLQVRIWTGDALLHLDGSPAETILDVLQLHSAPLDAEEGRYERRAEFEGGRLVDIGDVTVPISALRWTETVQRSPHTTVMEPPGQPVLILEELDEEGNPKPGRMVVDRELYAWQIDDEGRVAQKRSLTGADEITIVQPSPPPEPE